MYAFLFSRELRQKRPHTEQHDLYLRSAVYAQRDPVICFRLILGIWDPVIVSKVKVSSLHAHGEMICVRAQLEYINEIKYAYAFSPDLCLLLENI